MKIERTKNAMRNIMFDGFFRVLNMLLPFIMRSVILYYLGASYLGLNGLFRSILSILNLAELGVGSAMVFSMYKPIAEDDTESICALMRLYRTFYRIIGLSIAVIGLLLTPFLPDLINGDIPPDMNLYILYFMNLGSTVITYWLFSYKRSLLYAHQRVDVVSKVAIPVKLVEFALKIIMLVIFRNYYLYLLIQFLSYAAENLITAKQVTKLYPRYSARGDLPKEKVMDIMHRVRDLFTAKFSNVIFNSADTLVISAFIGLDVLAVYQNYFFIITSLRTFLEVFISACIAGVGNSLITENVDKNYKDFGKITMLFGWIMCVSSAMLLCMYQPFIEIWMGKDSLLAYSYVICFVIYFYTMGMNKIMNMFKDAAGIWHKDRFRPLVSALVNLALNLVLIRSLDLYGVLLSSVISIVVVQIPWLFHNLFREVFPRKYAGQYLLLLVTLTVIAIGACAGSWFLSSLLDLGAWANLFVNAGISFVISNIIFLAAFGRDPMFKQSFAQMKNVVQGKLQKH